MPDDHANFSNVLRRLLRVPKHEMDEEERKHRAAEEEKRSNRQPRVPDADD
jgi:hypothetical protein